ncbi:hypothetical protein ACIPPM_06075 [Streptomyces sp. NPDC090119]|uniref:hypothetical protein n=1 Tax=Streptomyces sp. NPDC090119 TaxID=3365951 RepID=UPI00380A2B12
MTAVLHATVGLGLAALLALGAIQLGNTSASHTAAEGATSTAVVASPYRNIDWP